MAVYGRLTYTRCYKCDSDFQEIRDMYELRNGDTRNPKYRKMIKFCDAVSDIYTEFKAKLLSTKNQKPMRDEQICSILIKSSNIPALVFGIKNIGNTCFFNSTMQALNATRELVDYYVSNQATFEDDSLLLPNL